MVESADYKLTSSASEWRLTPEEDVDRASQAAAGMIDFMKSLAEAVELEQRLQEGDDEPLDEQDDE